MGELQYIGSSRRGHDAATAAYAAFEYLRRGPRGVSFCTSRGTLMRKYSIVDENVGDPKLATRDPSTDRLNDEVILTCCRYLAATNPPPASSVNSRGPFRTWGYGNEQEMTNRND
jgi:hypothetical protein